MKTFLKQLIPQDKLQLFYKLRLFPSILSARIFKLLKITSSVYYAFVNRSFGREHRAVLAGKAEYYSQLNQSKKTSTLLRRNIHRIEKGLVMRPRRKIFAENFIYETVEILNTSISNGQLLDSEKKWAIDVLEEYFKVVDETKIIKEAFKKFINIFNQNDDQKKFKPYLFKELPENRVEFNDLATLFKRRRSVRWYKELTVPEELIKKSISIASLAPSACNRLPYKFYVCRDKQKVLKIANCAGGTPGWASNIPCIIVIIGDLSSYPSERDRHLIYIDSALAAMQLMLALETVGLSSCPINWPDIESSENALGEILKLKAFERPVMMISVGYADELGGIPYSQKKDIDLLYKKV